MNSDQLKTLIIEPTLKLLGLYDMSAVNLLLGTAAVESDCGEYIEQIPSGYAEGIYQIEMATHDDIVNRFLANQRYDHVRKVIMDLKIRSLSDEQNLVGNLYYSTAIARMVYYRIPTILPLYNSKEELARYWKRYYNTFLGKGTTEKFIYKYDKFIGDL